MRYRCLNRRCTKADTFQSHEKMPPCPACGCIRTEWLPPARGASSVDARHVDSTLRGLADSFGLSDINNKDGQAAKAARDTPAGTFGKMNIAGVEVPVEGTATGAWGKSSYTPFAVQTKGKFGGRKPIPTQVVARHEGRS